MVNAQARHDLKIAPWEQGRYRDYRDVKLENGEQIIGYRDLVRDGWYPGRVCRI